jgi:outer membrane protein TolC
LTLKAVVETTLLLDPTILIQEEQQTVALGNFLVQAGFFDIFLNADAAYTHDRFPLQKHQQIFGIDSRDTDSGIVNARVSKTFRNGVSIIPSVNMLRQQNNINKVLNIPIENRSFVNFAMNVPFFKGSAPGLSADATYLSFLAQQYNYAHTMSRSVLNSIVAYWEYRGAYESMNYLTGAIKTDLQTVNSIREMVKNGEQTQTDLDLAKANYQGRQALYYATRARYYEAKRTLAQIMGITSTQMKILPPPVSPFPKQRPMQFTQASLPKFFANMMRCRNDIRAAFLNIKANYALLKLQKTNLGPQLDGNVAVGYRGLNEGASFGNALSNNAKGPVATVGVTYSFPIENNTARGNFLAQSGVYAQSQITYKDLLRTIKLSLILAFNSVQLFGAQYGYSIRANHYYNVTINNEYEKLKFGEASLIDVLRIKDLLIQAELSAIESHKRYAQSLASLYFEQGLFICQDSMQCMLDLKPLS